MNKEKIESQEMRLQEQTNQPAAQSLGTRPYQAPTLTKFGSLVDLVQSRGGPGRDGGPFSDCTAS